MSDYWNQSRIGRVWCFALLALSASACGSAEPPARPGGANGSGASGATGATGSGGAGTVTAGIDPGRVGIHRLNNTEYNNTVRDLLQVTARPATNFLAEEGLSFDNTATALGMTGPQYELYYGAAETLAEIGRAHV